MKPSRLKRIAPAWLIGLATQSIASAANFTPAQQIVVTSISGSKSSSNGYFLFTGSVPVPGCEAGFWLPASDTAYSSTLATAKSALGNKTKVLVSGDRDQMWPGSGDHYCRVSQLQ